MDLEEQVPLLRGCPDRGGERGIVVCIHVPDPDARCASGPACGDLSVHVAHLEEQAPLLRGCPDRGGERPAKGGAQRLRSNVWGEVRAAHFASRAR